MTLPEERMVNVSRIALKTKKSKKEIHNKHIFI